MIASGYIDLTSNILFQQLYAFVLNTPFRKNAGSAQEEVFDPVQNHSLLGVIGGEYLLKIEGGEGMQLFTEEDFGSLGLRKEKRYLPLTTGKESLPRKQILVPKVRKRIQMWKCLMPKLIT